MKSMDFEALKKEWAELQVPHKTRAELFQMTKPSPRVKKMRMKLALDCVISVAYAVTFIITYNLVAMPWGAIAVIACTALYIYNDFLGYQYLTVLPEEENIRLSFVKHHARIKRLDKLTDISKVSMIVVSLLVLYWPRVGGTIHDWFIVWYLFVFVTWLASNRWKKRAKEMEKLLKEFEEE
jgi:hypothetical protein